MSILKEIGLGVAVALLIYQVLESWELFGLSKRFPKAPITGPLSLRGRIAEVVEPFSRHAPAAAAFGTVRVDGELWRAMMIKEIACLPQAGQRVRIVGREDLVLKVEHTEQPELT